MRLIVLFMLLLQFAVEQKHMETHSLGMICGTASGKQLPLATAKTCFDENTLLKF